MTCLVCDSKINKIFYKSESWEIIMCLSCGFAWTSPRPHYRNYVEDDFHAQFNFRNIDELPYLWRESEYIQLGLLSKFLDRGSKILEIGCGQGLLLKEFNNRGFDTMGIEPSLNASNLASRKGLNVIQGFYPNLKLKNKKFDAIYASQVLEHVEDLETFLQSIKINLSSGGIVMFTQTNFLGLLPKVNKNNWYAWVPEQHFWHFTPSSMTKLLSKHGFKKLEIKYSSLVHPDSILLKISRLIPTLGDQFHILLRYE